MFKGKRTWPKCNKHCGGVVEGLLKRKCTRARALSYHYLVLDLFCSHLPAWSVKKTIVSSTACHWQSMLQSLVPCCTGYDIPHHPTDLERCKTPCMYDYQSFFRSIQPEERLVQVHARAFTMQFQELITELLPVLSSPTAKHIPIPLMYMYILVPKNSMSMVFICQHFVVMSQHFVSTFICRHFVVTSVSTLL